MAPVLENIPKVKVGVVGVSRDCFPIEITRRRMSALMREMEKTGVDAHACGVVIESENDVPKALAELAGNGANALFAYLGNFGPEIPTTMLMQRFPGPCMVAGAAEEDKAVLKAGDRGDALCGLLSNSFNLRMRGVRAFIPQYPIGDPAELAACATEFAAIARVVIGVRNLKIFVFGPRPHDFMTCHAPLQPLYDIGVEIMENSELDLLAEYRAAESDKALIDAIANDMAGEFPNGPAYPDLLPRLARLEAALLKFKDRHLGISSYAAFADKCWPAFGPEFGFEPCYVNAHMAGKGYPVACEVDIYGALSEYMAMCAAMRPATILDVNNSVPDDVLPEGCDLGGATKRDLFMGFHCGNTCAAYLEDCEMKYNFMMQRGIGLDKLPDISRGTNEGRIRPGEITWFRAQSAENGGLKAYIAEGESLDVDPSTPGGTGVFAVPGFARFYRHVLVGRSYPHHAALVFGRAGETLYEAARLLGIGDIGVPLPANVPYPGENPFTWAKRRD